MRPTELLKRMQFILQKQDREDLKFEEAHPYLKEKEARDLLNQMEKMGLIVVMVDNTEETKDFHVPHHKNGAKALTYWRNGKPYSVYRNYMTIGDEDGNKFLREYSIEEIGRIFARLVNGLPGRRE